jgi:glycosyltransferase involved in cell wall biosynthesis
MEWRGLGMSINEAELFTTIIPAYNRADLISKAIDSVLAQEFRSHEIIVVDDGSSDDTLAVLANYGNRIRVLRQTNQGPGAARNLGIQHARSDYIAFLDSDDAWFPWTLDTYRQAIEEYHQPSIVVGKPYLTDDMDDITPIDRSEGDFKAEHFSDYLVSGDQWRWWGVSSFVIRRDLLRACGGFTSQRVNAEDADLMLRLGTAAGFVQVLAPTTFKYRQHSGNLTANLDNTVAGVSNLIANEAAGLYPGGERRANERRRIITRHIRPVSLELLAQGRQRDAWSLFKATLRWHARELRWRYLLGFCHRSARVQSLNAIRIWGRSTSTG